MFIKRLKSLNQSPTNKFCSFTQDLPSALEYIKNSIKQQDYVTYLIQPYLPQKIRDPYMIIYHLNYVLGKIPQSTKETNLARSKLNFWQENIQEICKNDPNNPSQTFEPIGLAIKDVIVKEKFGIGEKQLNSMIKARLKEIEYQNIRDMSELIQLAESSRLPPILITLQLLQILGFKGYEQKELEAMQECAVLIARGVGLCDYIKRIPYGLSKYKLQLPEDIMRKHTISVRTLWDRVEGKPKDELGDVVLEIAAYAKKCIDKSKELKSQLPKQAFRAFLHGVESEYFLDSLEQIPTRIWQAARKQQYFLNS